MSRQARGQVEERTHGPSEAPEGRGSHIITNLDGGKKSHEAQETADADAHAVLESQGRREQRGADLGTHPGGLGTLLWPPSE